MQQPKKKELRNLKICLIISFFLVLGSTYASPSDWIQLVDTTDGCYFCQTTYLVCKYAPLEDYQKKFNVYWRNAQGTIQTIKDTIPNLEFSVFQNKTYSYSCPTNNFNYTLNPYPKAWCFHDNGTLIRYIENFAAWDVPTKTVWWQKELFVPKTFTELKDGFINADVGTCKKLRISGTLREGSVDHYIEWIYNHTEYAWWASNITPTTPYFNVSADSGGFNSVYCRAQSFVKTGGNEIAIHIAFMADGAVTGNPEGGCTIAIQADNAGNPGTVLAYANFTDAECSSTTTNYTHALNESVTLVNGTTYWVSYNAKDSAVDQYYRARRDAGNSFAGGVGKTGTVYSGWFCTSWAAGTDTNFMLFKFNNISTGAAYTAVFNHTELNSSIDYSHVNITVNTSFDSTVCNVTIDSILHDMISFNTTSFYYEWNDTTEGNHTYFANCTNGSRYANTTLGWTYINVSLEVVWDWPELNTTINTTASSTIYVNTTNATICIINFNHTNYTMTDLGDRWSYFTGLLANGNYSVIYVICNDSLNSTNQTTLGWLNVSYTTPSNTTLAHNTCPFYVDINEAFLFWANYSTSDGVEISTGTVNITVDNTTYTLSWNGADELYKGNFTFTEYGDFEMDINATSAFRSANSTCTIYVIDAFNITVRIWEEVEREVFARTNNTVITVKNYDVELTDPYINELGWIYLINLDRNDSRLYTDCNVPVQPGQDLLEILNWNNYFGDNYTASLKQSSGSLVWCDKYWFRGEYSHGEANITAYWPGNYTVIFVSGTITHENAYSPPDIAHGSLTIPLGSIFFENSSNLVLDYYLPHSEINWWSAFTDGIFIFLALIFPLLLFVYLMIVGVGVKTALTIAGAFPLIMTFIRMIGVL